MALEEIIWFVFMGLLGGITYVFINSDSLDDLTKFDSVKRYAVGAISGFIYDILYSDYGFPNFIMCFVSGYMGITFLEGIINRFGPKKEAEITPEA